MLFEYSELEIDILKSPGFIEKEVIVMLARLDKLHPVVSGNKMFKLHYFIRESVRQGNKPVITFGGAWSNHLVASAYACSVYGIPCTGVVRGEKPSQFSQTLQDAEHYGMELHFVTRSDYQEMDLKKICEQISKDPEKHIIIPEGGFHPMGAEGGALIMNHILKVKATHICTAVGTATTLAGLLKNSTNNERIIAVPVLKNMTDIKDRLTSLGCSEQLERLSIFENYHFGGYAKKNEHLIRFMNECFNRYHIPTDFVYTAKMLYAVTEKIKQGFFAPGSVVLCLHTGGLQGNKSLPPGTLVF